MYHVCKVHKVKRDHLYSGWQDGGSKVTEISNWLRKLTWLT